MNSLFETSEHKTKMRLEDELLLCCARTSLNSVTTERIKALVHQGIDWGYLIRIAIWHGVMPLLYWNLKNTSLESIPKDQQEQLHKYFQTISCRNLFLTKELIKLLHLCEAHNIPMLPFKGPILAIQAYKNLSLRQISDLDILVNKEDFEKVVDLLVSQKYKIGVDVPWECHLVGDDGISNIDLHRDIVPKHLSCPINDDYWWENLEPFHFAGTLVPNLSPQAWLILLCLNGTKECWQSLNRICDVAEVIRTNPEINWPLFIEQAKKQGLERLVSLGIVLAVDLLAAPVPEKIYNKLKSNKAVNFLAKKVVEQLFSESKQSVDEVERTLYHISTRERWIDKAQSFWGLMVHSGWFTPTEKDMTLISLPQKFYWLYYFIRPIRVISKYRLVKNGS